MSLTGISDQSLAVVHTYNANACGAEIGGLLQDWKHIGCFTKHKFQGSICNVVRPCVKQPTKPNKSELWICRTQALPTQSWVEKRKAILRRNTKTSANEIRKELKKLKSHLSQSDLGPSGMLLFTNENLGHYYGQLLVGMPSHVFPSILRENLYFFIQGANESIPDAMTHLEGEPYLSAITQVTKMLEIL